MKMIKKLSAALCCVMLLTACGSREPAERTSLPAVVSVPVPVPAESSSSETSTVSEPETVPEPEPVPEDAHMYTAYALYCVEDDEMLDSYNADKRIAPASLTKLMTASVTLRYSEADEVITVGSELELVNEDSSLCMIAPGEMLTVYDLLTGLLLPSGNDAAYTAAVTTARKVKRNDLSDNQAVWYFCKLMNDMARELGMTGSHFADPDGWDDPNHYTTASDLVKIAKYALTVPEIREIVSTPKKEVVFETGEYAVWYNGNKLLHPESDYYCKNAIGMKTGYTDDAGLCLVAAFVKNGKTYITVTVGSEEDEDRYNKTLQLFDDIL